MRIAPTIAVAVCIASPLLARIDVHPSKASFNPTLHETVSYEIRVGGGGILTAQILDRDLYVTKTLALARRVTSGPVVLTWDGTDENGRTVADEAWSIRVALKSANDLETYVPASVPAVMATIRPDSYDVQSGVLRYTLPVASRVHLEAGVADRQSKDPTAGAVMKTIVNREPRPAGAIIEQWMGMDESGTVYVPALANFVVSIAATPLPESSVITYGNRQRDFLHTALQRTGVPVLTKTVHGHHAGLSALDDIAPHLIATPEHAHWQNDSKKWLTSSPHLRLSLTPRGETSDHFVRQPGRLVVYVDKNRVVDKVAGVRSIAVEVPRDSADHIVAVNWVSAYGPVAATAFKVQYSR